MKKLLSIILSIVLVFSMSSAALASNIEVCPEDTEQPSEVKILKVATSADFKPFEYYDENGKLTGFDIDLMKYIGEEIGFDIEFVNMSFDKLIPAVVNSEVDCAISAITVTEERDSIIDYSRDYLKTYNITFNENGERSTKYGEQYAIVFREGLSGSPYEDLTEPTIDETVYILIDKALRELSNDGTVTKLIEKYELNKPLDESAVNVEYSAIIGTGDPVAKTEDSEPKTSNGTPLAPPSDWALSDVEKAEALNITKDEKIYRYRMSITREEFCELAYNYIVEFGKDLEVSNNYKFKDTDNEKIEALNSLGIIYGKSETEFAPNDLLTREEAATILNRLINVVHPDLASTELYFEFTDSEQISDWSMSAIQRICNMGIMKGVGNNNFAPQDNYTTEQAIVTLVRVYAYSGVSKNIIGGADGPTEIVVVETVTVKNTSTGEEKTLSADDSKAILDILVESNDWTEGTADCLNDCEIKIGDRTIMYHSDCGTFNDNTGKKSISLDEKVKPYINSILEKYIRLGYDITAE